MKKKTAAFLVLFGIVSAMLCGCSEKEPLNRYSVPASLDGYEKQTLFASWHYGYCGVGELSANSDVIAKVKITGSKIGPDIAPELMSTIFTAKVEELIYGSNEKEIDIFMTGGIDHEQKRILEIHDDPLMNIGDEFMVFAQKNEDGTYTILGGPQGRFVIDNDCVYSLTEYNSGDSAEGINVLSTGGGNLNDFIEEIKSYII